MTSLFAIAATFAVYFSSKFFYQRFRHILLSPLLLCPLILVTLLIITQIPYSYYQAGGQYLTFMLQPATVALAVPLYKYRVIINRYRREILTAVLGSSLLSLLTSIFLAQWAGLPPTVVASLAPRSVTTPIALHLAPVLGGIPALAAAFVILTGLIGTILASLISLRLKSHPVTTGMFLGITAHGTGTARAHELGPLEGAVASLSMIFMAIATTLFIPAVIGCLLP